MTLDAQTIVNILFGIICAGGGWWMNTVYKAHEALREQFNSLAVALPTHYVMKSDMHDLREAIFERFDRLEVKLDRKVDR